ncbi:hypothetical protein EVAR_38669_1 [Eumeta japonica]|uniref:Uncharacterized protein n=1 Tax=Eumeta variegata TaxID=151549 RepID=A0A4C1YAC8_EUMVA|nr:hypothetical protein EVAR_38669_1 [Eumeta japonica]
MAYNRNTGEKREGSESVKLAHYIIRAGNSERHNFVRCTVSLTSVEASFPAKVRIRFRAVNSKSRRRSDADRSRVYRSEVEEEIIRQFYEDPTTSTNIVAARMGLLHWKVWFTLHSARLYPYHYTSVHATEESDPARRLDFCTFMLHADAENPEFLKKILWTDDSKLNKDGITNYHNTHYWSDKDELNPHKRRVRGSQRRFSVNA